MVQWQVVSFSEEIKGEMLRNVLIQEYLLSSAQSRHPSMKYDLPTSVSQLPPNLSSPAATLLSPYFPF